MSVARPGWSPNILVTNAAASRLSAGMVMPDHMPSHPDDAVPASVCVRVRLHSRHPPGCGDLRLNCPPQGLSPGILAAFTDSFTGAALVPQPCEAIPIRP